MIFLYILEYIIIGFLYVRFIHWMAPEESLSNLSQTVTIILWPIPVTFFLLGVVKGLYNQITNNN